MQQQHLTHNEMEALAEKEGYLGWMLISRVKDGRITRQYLPTRVFRHGKTDSVRLLLKNPGSYYGKKGYGKKTARVRKLQLADATLPLPEIVTKLSEVYTDILAAQLSIGGRNERWVNPTIAETFLKMVEARKQASQANGNDAARRFWQKFEKLHSFDVDLPFEALESELKHFEKKISMWL